MRYQVVELDIGGGLGYHVVDTHLDVIGNSYGFSNNKKDMTELCDFFNSKQFTRDRSHDNWWTGIRLPSGSYYLYDRHQQFETLWNAICDDAMPDDPELWWEIVTDVWQYTEHPRQQAEAWTEIFAQNPGHNAATVEWLKAPKTLYRGFQNTLKDYAWSWTVDKEQAHWFANRYSGSQVYDQNPAVKQIPVSKLDPKSVLCAMTDYEGEVLLRC
jgi:hypothetical protein